MMGEVNQRRLKESCVHIKSKKSSYFLQTLKNFSLASLIIKFTLLLPFPQGSSTASAINERYGNYTLEIYRKYPNCNLEIEKIHFGYYLSERVLKEQTSDKILKIQALEM